MRYRASQKVTKADGQTNDRFSDAITVVGETIAITAREDDTFANNAGAVYLYDREARFLRVLGSPNAEDGGFFGEYMAPIGNDRLIIAARMENEKAGRAYVFNVDVDLLHTLEAETPEPGAEFGGRVVLSHDEKILIASTRDHSLGDNGGAAFLYNLEGELLQTFVSPRPDVTACFGRNGALVGDDKVLISDACDSSFGVRQAGAAFLFDLEGNLLQSFDNPQPEALDGFGTSVAYAADRILIGGAQIDDEINDASTGAAYIFELDGKLVTRVSDPEPIPGNWFGWNAGAIGDLFVVGSIFNSSQFHRAGKAFLVNRDGGIVQSLTSPEPGAGQQFGAAFATLDDILLIGETQHGGGFPSGTGAVWMFAPVEPGDFNENGLFDVDDLDLLCHAALRGRPRNRDITGDELVTSEDVTKFLDLAGSLPGDADLDGSVTFQDFLALADGFGEAGNWSAGDFNCNRQVEFGDFLIVSSHFGQSAAAAASVPEPNLGAGLFSLLVATSLVRRSRRKRYSDQRRHLS